MKKIPNTVCVKVFFTENPLQQVYMARCWDGDITQDLTNVITFFKQILMQHTLKSLVSVKYNLKSKRRDIKQAERIMRLRAKL